MAAETAQTLDSCAAALALARVKKVHNRMHIIFVSSRQTT